MANGRGGKFKSGCLGTIVVLILIGALASPKSGSSGSSNNSSRETSVRQESSVRHEESSQMRKSTSNPYGSFSTPCKMSGCTSYITMTGYSHYCYTHSDKCAGCGAYIDPDTTYCPECAPSH